MFLFSSLLPVLGRLYECNQYCLWLQDVLLPKMLWKSMFSGLCSPAYRNTNQSTSKPRNVTSSVQVTVAEGPRDALCHGRRVVNEGGRWVSVNLPRSNWVVAGKASSASDWFAVMASSCFRSVVVVVVVSAKSRIPTDNFAGTIPHKMDFSARRLRLPARRDDCAYRVTVVIPAPN